MRKQVTMKDVAQQMDVSIVSVSKALSGKEGVSEELRKKIIDKAREMGYAAGGKKKEAVGVNAALIISERYVSERSFYVQIYQKMIMGLSEKGFIGILEIVKKENEEKGILPATVLSGTVQQAVIIGEMHSAFLDKMLESGIRTVFFDFLNEEYDVDAIVSDNINGGYLLTRMLVKNGYQKIGFVGEYRATRSILDRFMGYMKYLLAKDRRMEPSWVLPDRDTEGEYVEVALPLQDMPEAFVCNNDEAACRLIDTLGRAGYRVPQDIAVTGYDDYASRETAGLKLTTWHVNVDEMIRLCIQLIEARTSDPGYRLGTVTVTGQMVQGQTAGKWEK